MVTLSNSVSIPDNTDLHFFTKGSNVVPFSFSIPVKNRFTINSNVNYSDQVVGHGIQHRTVQSAVTDGKIITLNPGSDGIVAGMAIEGNDLVNTPGYDYLRVASVDVAARTVSVDVNQNIAEGTSLKFVRPETMSYYAEYNENIAPRDLQLVYMQVGSSDGNVTIEGYLDITSLGDYSADIDILIDNLITII